MTRFVKDKYLRKIKLKRYNKYFYLGSLCLFCFIIGFYFAHSRFNISKDSEVVKTTVGDFIYGDVVIGAYLNGEYSKNLPQKEDGYIVDKIECDNDTTAEWNYESWSLNTKNLTTRSKCNIYFKDGVLANYSGSEEVFTVPITGTYKLEVWGAQGTGWFRVIGGYGGYATGEISLQKGQKLYLNIGNQAENKPVNPNGTTPPGGGATYIALSSGNLTTFEKNLSSLLIVAGGGGGSEWYGGYGGSGGGYIGNAGGQGSISSQSNPSPSPTAQGGSQTAGGTSTAIDSRSKTSQIYNGSFGKGGYIEGGDGGGQGGNGFYGGGASSYAGGGGGGSGYIGNSLLKNKSMYCNDCSESSEETTKTISTTCTSETPTENCAKKGNGYVRITLVTSD